MMISSAIPFFMASHQEHIIYKRDLCPPHIKKGSRRYTTEQLKEIIELTNDTLAKTKLHKTILYRKIGFTLFFGTFPTALIMGYFSTLLILN